MNSTALGSLKSTLSGIRTVRSTARKIEERINKTFINRNVCVITATKIEIKERYRNEFKCRLEPASCLMRRRDGLKANVNQNKVKISQVSYQFIVFASRLATVQYVSSKFVSHTIDNRTIEIIGMRMIVVFPSIEGTIHMCSSGNEARRRETFFCKTYINAPISWARILHFSIPGNLSSIFPHEYRISRIALHLKSSTFFEIRIEWCKNIYIEKKMNKRLYQSKCFSTCS